MTLITSCGGGTRPPPLSDDAGAADLVLSGVVLDQIFQTGSLTYTATVSLFRPTTTVTASPSNANATMTVNDDALDAGAPSDKIPLNQGSNTIALRVTAEDGVTTATYTVEVIRKTAASVAQRAYIKATDTRLNDKFGVVAFDDDTLIVGAPFERSDATGIDGDQSNENAPNSGAVYVFTRDPSGVWSQQAFIKASNTGANDNFGISVALDGDTLAVGASREQSNATGINGDQTDNSFDSAGAVYVFTRGIDDMWSQQAYIKAPSSDTVGNVFGLTLALDGDTLAVGMPGDDSSATGINGDHTDIGAATSGAVFVFTRDDAGVWSQQAYVKASNTDAGDFFAKSVALDGDTLAVGADFESSNATGIDGDQADNSATRSGAVYVFTRDTSGVWSQQAYVKASNAETSDFFGRSIALDEDTLIVSASGERSLATGVNGDQTDNGGIFSGAVYVFSRDASGGGRPQAYIKASNTEMTDSFGRSVSLSGDALAVGAYGEDSSATGINGDQFDNSVIDSGAVYIYTRDVSGVWSQQAYIKASNTEANDYFGSDPGVFQGNGLALDGGILIIGAQNEDSNATGIDGDQANNGANQSGAAYVFE